MKKLLLLLSLLLVTNAWGEVKTLKCEIDEEDYASLKVVKGGTVFKNGTCKNGKLHGEVWETMTFPAEDGLGKTTFILAGNYIEGKKEGVFNQYQNGRKFSVAWYEDNKRVSAKNVEV